MHRNASGSTRFANEIANKNLNKNGMKNPRLFGGVFLAPVFVVTRFDPAVCVWGIGWDQPIPPDFNRPRRAPH